MILHLNFVLAYAEIKMLQNEVAALWKAHTELLVLYNNIVDKPTEERS